MSKSKLSISGPDLSKNVKAKQDIVVKASSIAPGSKGGGSELVKTVK